jgi:exopolyphosphatase/guanosine-5'-triphosphate,3'-diphosphate pyrophosphatase
MSSSRRAVIDIGTNSVKLLVGEVEGLRVIPLWERGEQTRLGKGFYATHHLQPEAIQRTAKAVADFIGEAAQWRATSIRLIATSAARDAVNRAELAEAIRQSARLPMEIISGEQEADWAFQGVASDPRLAGHPLLIMDTGGGSTQLIYYAGSGECIRHSFRLGAVRMLEQFQPSDPPTAPERLRCQTWLSEFAGSQVRPALGGDLHGRSRKPLRLVGTGGASSLLVAMHLGLRTFDRELIEATILSLTDIRQRINLLWRLPLVERKQVPGLPPPKADVVLMGTAIHLAVMEAFRFDQLTVSTRGVRFAALLPSDHAAVSHHNSVPCLHA